MCVHPGVRSENCEGGFTFKTCFKRTSECKADKLCMLGVCKSVSHLFLLAPDLTPADNYMVLLTAPNR